MSQNVNTIPINDPSDNRPAWDRLLDDDNYDDQGKFKAPIVEGESGNDAPPATEAAKAASTTENTAATQPSPDASASTAKPTGTELEKKTEPGTGGTAEGTGTATEAKPAVAADEEESEEAIKARLTKPGDTGNEWQMRYYREGERLHKKLAPIQAQLDAIGSPDRATRGLEFVHVIGAMDQPIAEAAKKLTELSASRAVELRDHFIYETVDHYPDAVAHELMGEEVTLQELKDGLALLRSGAKTGQETQPQSITLDANGEPVKPAWFTDDEWADFKVDYEPTFKRMKEQAKAAPQPSAAASVVAGTVTDPPEDPKIAALTKELSELKEQQQTVARKEYLEEIDREGQKINQEAYSLIDERLRELGLEPDTAKDDEATTKLKQKTINDIRTQVEADFEGPNGPGGWEDWSLLSEEQKANRKLEAEIITLLAKKDYRAARDLIDPLKMRIDLTLDRVVTAHMKQFSAAMAQPTETTRNAGNGHQRPELVGGVAATGIDGGEFAKTPWLDPKNRLPGESGEDAMRRYLDTHSSLPGR